MRVRSLRTYEIIWQTVRGIPKGRVATYGQVALLSGFIGQARLVGYALHGVPPSMKIPWHRVINAQGRISLPRGGGQYARQKRMLMNEGVMFVKEKIDLQKYGWMNKGENG